MTPQDDERDPLIDERYRQASEAAAGKPSAATREAILREAREAALRSTPAANDSRWWIRAAAGLAVVGIASLILFEANRQGHLSPHQEAPVPAAAPVMSDTGASAVPSSETARVAPQSRRDEDAKYRKRASDANGRFAQSAPPSAELESDMSAGPARVAAAPAPIAQGQLAETVVAKSADQALFEKTFPAVYASSTPPQEVWIAQDNAGRPLRRGVLPGGEAALERDEVTRHITKGLQVLSERVATVTTEQGAEVQMLIIVANP